MINQKYKTIIQAAEAGGKILKKYFGTNLEVEEKTMASDVCTKADKESEKDILDILLKDFSDYNILAEEGGFSDKGSDFTFIIDPLDGTNNFVLGIPYFTVAIALLKKDQTVFSVIHNPITDQTYYAEKNQGSFLKDKQLKMSDEIEIERSSIAYSAGYKNYRLEYHNDIKKKLEYNKRAKRVLVNWCPTMDFCLLAAGKIEAIINDDNEVYDYIAGKLIAQEAGAVITDFKGQEQKDRASKFLASNNKVIHNKVLEVYD